MLRGNRDDCLYFFLHFTINNPVHRKRSAKAAQIHLKRRWLLTIAFRGGCLQILNFIDSKNRRLSSLWFLRPMLYPVLGQECIKLIRRSGFDVI